MSFTKDKRFEEEKLSPGPGDYDSNSRWVKKSFNLKYL